MLALRDPVSSSSHLLTAIWAVFATLVMFRLTTNRPGRMLPVLVYGASMVALFLASGTFHAPPFEKGSWPWVLLQKIDQTAVYLLIAGTYTPVLSILLTGAWRKWFLRMVWALAAAGISCLWLLPKVPHWGVVVIYLSLGWIGILPLPLYYRAVGWRAMNWMWAGALLYTAGAVCEITEWPKVMPGFGFHEILHLCDSAANMVFFLFVVRYVIPYQPAPTPAPPSAATGDLLAPAKPAPVVG
ncbi:hemolysin III family protein [Gemmata sp. JC673]|uniref:Hemolysin III family protein n=1 Tax=Gemmata algarum TaxID=2975278 RepID=A0ABU5EV15_9BACT|nr:hemolysin III family protein [Gemmata algarum]MDY3557668.1 hemolysin III family protein [Gemmata algarum]